MNSDRRARRKDDRRPKQRGALLEWSLRLLLVIMGGLVSLVLLECAVRFTGMGSDQLLQRDAALGVRFIPAKSGLEQGECYKAHVSINSQGWRSPEVALKKPSDVYRVLILGDSFMAGLQVDDNQVFASLLQKQLNRSRPGRRVEVLNFGVPSWGTDQEYLALCEYGLRYQPDLVLLAFFAQNDVYDNAPALHSRISTHNKPFFDLKDGKLAELPFVDDTPAVISHLQTIGASLRLYPLLRDRLMSIPAVDKLLFKLGLVSVVPPKTEVDDTQKDAAFLWPNRWRRQLGVYAKHYPPEWQHAWDVTERLLLETRERAKERGAGFQLMLVSDPVVVMPAALREKMASPGELEALDFDRPSRLLKEFAAREAINFTSLVPGFRDKIGKDPSQFARLYLQCDGHWSAAGHRLAAELITPTIAAGIVSHAGTGSMKVSLSGKDAQR